MVQINDKTIENVVNFPKNQNLEGDLILKLHSELTQKTYSFNVVDEGRSKRYYKFTLDFSEVDNGEYDYSINDAETGLIRIGLVEQSTPSVVVYTDEVNIIQYSEDYSSDYRLQNKVVTYTNNGENIVTADAGYYGLRNVIVNVEVPVDEYYASGYSSGLTDGYVSGKTDGVAEQKAKLSATAITVNGNYTRGDGWSAVTVNVAQTGHTDEELQQAYQSGWTAGYESGKKDKNYLNFDIISGGTINWRCTNSGVSKTIMYKINNGNWNSIVSTTQGYVINVNAGDIIYFKGDNLSYGSTENSNHYNTFENSTAIFNISGNILSLVDSINFESLYTIYGIMAFNGLFLRTKVVDAGNLILQATTLSNGCYISLFEFCRNLITAPSLPATVLQPYCYDHMFEGCVLLETAPVLPAEVLEEACYQGMFYNDSSLSYIKCLAVDLSAAYALQSFCGYVSPTGTFVKKAGVQWPEGRIPSGWTVIEE